MESDFSSLKRPTREKVQQALFDLEPDWHDDWWGMPEFSNDDIRPLHRITFNFLTDEDKAEFASKLGIRLGLKQDSAWYPAQQTLKAKEYIYTGQKHDSKYPICIPSKGRADCQTTGKLLDKLGVSYRFFVEEIEYDQYVNNLGFDKVVKLPFHDLGQGSIPARNFIWEWCKERGFKRHWTVDDNISGFYRVNLTRRLLVYGGLFFRAMEDYVDRYENVVMAGPHDAAFVPVGWTDNLRPVLLNSRVYSCILLDTSLPDRWRGRYNEDTDLSLRLLKQGYCTLLFHAFLMTKEATAEAKNRSVMKGGNTDNVYNNGDHRLAFAQSLKEQHPDVVEVVWKFNRWHHQVDYSNFKKNKLRLKPGITPVKCNNEYGMRLVRAKAIKEIEDGTNMCGEEVK